MRSCLVFVLAMMALPAPAEMLAAIRGRVLVAQDDGPFPSVEVTLSGGALRQPRKTVPD